MISSSTDSADQLLHLLPYPVPYPPDFLNWMRFSTFTLTSLSELIFWFTDSWFPPQVIALINFSLGSLSELISWFPPQLIAFLNFYTWFLIRSDEPLPNVNTRLWSPIHQKLFLQLRMSETKKKEERKKEKKENPWNFGGIYSFNILWHISLK